MLYYKEAIIIFTLSTLLLLTAEGGWQTQSTHFRLNRVLFFLFFLAFFESLIFISLLEFFFFFLLFEVLLHKSVLMETSHLSFFGRLLIRL
jgi:hypothetical protein